MKEGEAIHDLTAAVGKDVKAVASFVIILAIDEMTTEEVSFGKDLVLLRTPVKEPVDARRVISFSGLQTD